MSEINQNTDALTETSELLCDLNFIYQAALESAWPIVGNVAHQIVLLFEQPRSNIACIKVYTSAIKKKVVANSEMEDFGGGIVFCLKFTTLYS